MSKRLIVILALAFVVGLAFTAYAEVQNVKVSGDITVKGVARDNFDLTKSASSAQIITSNFQDKDSDFLSIARVRVDADLTDNVSTTVRLLNERNWNGESNAAGNRNRNIGLNTGLTATDENDIDLDLAYVTLKEFLYSPLSLRVGRQELRFGNGLVVGDPDTNIFASSGNLAEGDLSSRKSFDAVRATLDYNPLVVDILYAKIEEGAANLNDDVSLGGINASYVLNDNTTLEGFLFSKVKGQNAAAVTNVDTDVTTSFLTVPAGDNILKDRADVVNTVGIRAVDKTIKNLSVDGQVAYQFGTYNPKFDPNARFGVVGDIPNRQAQTGARSAWAAQLMGIYDLKDVAMVSKYSPAITGSYTYLSGENRDRIKGTYKAWDPMFEDQAIGHIMNGIFAETNMHKASLSAKAKLTDDITANVDYVNAWFAKRFPRNLDRQVNLSRVSGARQFITKGGRSIGQEVDASLTYDYTEDVQLSLLGGVFLGSKNILSLDNEKDKRAPATEVIGSMKVTF